MGSQKGQIVVEYVLLLTIAVGLAVLITKTMVSRDPNNMGFLVRSWVSITQTIGLDTADDVMPQQQ